MLTLRSSTFVSAELKRPGVFMAFLFRGHHGPLLFLTFTALRGILYHHLLDMWEKDVERKQLAKTTIKSRTPNFFLACIIIQLFLVSLLICSFICFPTFVSWRLLFVSLIFFRFLQKQYHTIISQYVLAVISIACVFMPHARLSSTNINTLNYPPGNKFGLCFSSHVGKSIV